VLGTTGSQMVNRYQDPRYGTYDRESIDETSSEIDPQKLLVGSTGQHAITSNWPGGRASSLSSDYCADRALI
jgi:hypothetical protein